MSTNEEQDWFSPRGERRRDEDVPPPPPPSRQPPPGLGSRSTWETPPAQGDPPGRGAHAAAPPGAPPHGTPPGRPLRTPPDPGVPQGYGPPPGQPAPQGYGPPPGPGTPQHYSPSPGQTTPQNYGPPPGQAAPQGYDQAPAQQAWPGHEAPSVQGPGRGRGAPAYGAQPGYGPPPVQGGHPRQGGHPSPGGLAAHGRPPAHARPAHPDQQVWPPAQREPADGNTQPFPAVRPRTPPPPPVPRPPLPQPSVPQPHDGRQAHDGPQPQPSAGLEQAATSDAAPQPASPRPRRRRALLVAVGAVAASLLITGAQTYDGYRFYESQTEKETKEIVVAAGQPATVNGIEWKASVKPVKPEGNGGYGPEVTWLQVDITKKALNDNSAPMTAFPNEIRLTDRAGRTWVVEISLDAERPTDRLDVGKEYKIPGGAIVPTAVANEVELSFRPTNYRSDTPTEDLFKRETIEKMPKDIEVLRFRRR